MKKTFKTNKIEEWINFVSYCTYWVEKKVLRLLDRVIHGMILLFKGPGYKETLDKRRLLKSEKDFFKYLYSSGRSWTVMSVTSHMCLVMSIWHLVCIRTMGNFFYFAAWITYLTWVYFFCLSEKKSWYYLQKFQKMPRKAKVIKGIIAFLYVIFAYWIFMYTLKYHF